MKRSGWTEERKARQRQLIQDWRPWERSTGPRTAAGKATSSMNRYQGAVRSQLRELRRQLQALSRSWAGR